MTIIAVVSIATYLLYFSTVLLVLQASLSAPPSSVYCFRDISLYACVFKNLDVITSCEEGTKDLYWRWLKQHGAMDYIEDIVEEVLEPGFIIGDGKGSNFQIPKLDEGYLSTVVGRINEL